MVDPFERADNLESLFWYIVFGDRTDGRDPRFTVALYHYTNKETLDCFILHKNSLELRLTNLTEFSDKEEGRHILPVIKCSLKESYQAKEIDKTFFEKITGEINSYIQMSDDRSDWYVFSFSRNGDCAYLKKNYACRNKKPGAVLGIQTLELLDTAEGTKLINSQEKWNHIPIDDLPTVYLYDVIYDPAIIKARVRKMICKAYELYNKNQKNGKWLFKMVRAMIDLYKLHYKSPEFSLEEETRLIVNGRSIKKTQENYSLNYCFSDSSVDAQQSNSRYLYLNLNRNSAEYHAWTVDPSSFDLKDYDTRTQGNIPFKC